MILQLAQSLIAPVTGILDKFIEDKDQKAAMAHEIATIADKQANEQAKAQRQLILLCLQLDGDPQLDGCVVWLC